MLDQPVSPQAIASYSIKDSAEKISGLLSISQTDGNPGGGMGMAPQATGKVRVPRGSRLNDHLRQMSYERSQMGQQRRIRIKQNAQH